MAESTNTREYEEPLLNNSTTDNGGEVNSNLNAIQGVVDYRGEKVSDSNRSKFGGLRSASRIVLGEIVQAFCYFGQSLVTAAANVNVWTGVASVLPIVGALVADSYLGQYYTIISSFLIYILVSHHLSLFVCCVYPKAEYICCFSTDAKNFYISFVYRC